MPVEMPFWMGSTSNWGQRGGSSAGREFSGGQDQKHSPPWSPLRSPSATWVPPAASPPLPFTQPFLTDPTVPNSSSRHFFVPTCTLLCYNSSEHLTTNYFKVSKLSYIVWTVFLFFFAFTANPYMSSFYVESHWLRLGVINGSKIKTQSPLLYINNFCMCQLNLVEALHKCQYLYHCGQPQLPVQANIYLTIFDRNWVSLFWCQSLIKQKQVCAHYCHTPKPSQCQSCLFCSAIFTVMST